MKKILVIFLLVAVAGCAKKYTTPSGDGMSPEERVQDELMERGVPETDEYVEELLAPPEETVLESALSTEEQAKSIFRDLLFDYDQYDIRADARPILNSVAAFMNKNKDINIVIEGHCDDRGTNEYNLALGEKRAKAARDYLVSRGVSAERIISITFGEEKPLCFEQSESCWQSNRRAHFVIVKSRFQ